MPTSSRWFANPTSSETVLLMRTLRDMNLAKFIAQDVPLFTSLIDDIFPRVSKSLGAASWKELEVEVNQYLQENNLAAEGTGWYTKVI